MGILECKPVRIRVNGSIHHIQPVIRSLYHGRHEITLGKAASLKGGLIIGEGDTGKSIYARMLFDAVKCQGGRDPMLIRLRTRPQLVIPEVQHGETQTIILDGLDEYPECARDIFELTDDLDPNRYHVWVTSRPGMAASIVAANGSAVLPVFGPFM